MSITIGTRLDTYAIVARLGAGGMGEVYRAHDTKLNRDVALKILPEAFAGDADRLARFEREAQALAALNHPNIAHVYDTGTSGATSYIVMELVAGDDLSALIARGPLPVADALTIAAQVVNALEAAHDAGIVHRDLKPANIKVRPDGTVKVLDFGLAKVQPLRTSGSQQLADSPTVTSPAATMRGMILGTAAYMSPEQARGDAVDRRSDIWAFGAVVYEMLTGRRAFDGKNVTDVLGAVVHLDPDWNALPPDVPPVIRTLLHGCLQKDRARRVADISTARFAIDSAPSLAAPAATRGASRRWSMALAASTVLLALLGLAWLWTQLRSEPIGVTRHTVTPAEHQSVVQAGGVDVALSPDGSWMVYVGRAPGGGTMLLRRDLNDLDAVAVPGSEGAAAPVVSPDGRSVAFVANGAIRTLPVEGGPPFTVATAGGAPTWGEDGMIYYGRGNLTYRVSAQGGEPVIVTTPLPNVLQLHVDALPDGRGLLLTLLTGTPAQAQLAVVGPEGGAPRVLLAGTMARYAATGHLVYATADGTLLAAPFDVRRLEITGPSVPLAEGVEMDSSGTTEFAVSRSGSLVYTTGTGSLSELVWVTRAGVVAPVDASWTGEFGSPVLSPDGTRLAVAIQGQESKDIWVMQVDRGSKLRLTLDGARNDYPTWTPDGGSVTFASDRAGPSFDLWTKRSDGSGEPVLEIDEEWAIAEALWSPDGAWFVHRTSTNVTGAGDILARRTDRDVKPVPIVASRFTEVTPAISPNGRWMAYASSETGRREIVVVPFPNASDAKWPVSVGGGSEPLWSRDGGELFYRNGKGELVSARVQTTGTFSIGATSVLFPDRDYLRFGVVRQYDVTPDGQRFLMIRKVATGRESRLILVRNAFRGLESVAKD
ncbi:MAG: protein kinase [Vicinamibacterales bacterium]